jgi:iron complex outermembrane receptor protein
VFGLTWRINPALNVYASYGQGFETPTMNELSYRPDGTPGLNFALQPAKSDNYEIGMKALLGQATQLNLALFDVRTEDEIVTATSSGGRTTFRNGGRTSRTGVEASLATTWDNGFGLAAAYTYLDAHYRDTISATIRAGNAIPGIPRQSAFVEGSWQHKPSGFSSALELRHVAKVYVNDANADAAPAYTLASLRLGFEQNSTGWQLKEFVRVDNLTDKKYAGSVIVNESNARFFEPAPGRTWLAGVSLQLHF